jgi:dihydroorotase
LYLNDAISKQTISQAVATDFIKAVKLYPAGATTNSEFGVKDLQKFSDIFEVMQDHDLPLLIHGEVTYGDIFDRERIFIETQLIPLRQQFPQLRIVLEHITTATAVEYVKAQDKHLAATITAHHLLCERNDLLVGGLKPDYYCLPILKTQQDQQALLQAATSGDPHFFLGTDSAPHSTGKKYCPSGCAGIYTAYCAIELYALAFENMHAINKLEAFASFHGADFYQIARNTTTITLAKNTLEIPLQLTFGDEVITPFYAGKTLPWKLQA